MSAADPTVLFSCVAEGTARWISRVEDLVFSVRRFGGSCSDAPFVVNFVGEVPDRAGRALAELGADARAVEPIPGQPTANKLRMLDLHRSAEFEVLVALDCDTAVVADPRPRLSSSAIGAKPADLDPFTRRDWHRLHAALDLPPPSWSMRATSTGKPIPPYFNSGVLTIPRDLCEGLGCGWRAAQSELMAALGNDSRLIPKHLHFFSDQLSLAICLARDGLPFEPLPLAMNFPSHVGVDRSALTTDPAPVILHHHEQRDERGFLYRPRSPIAAEATQIFNRARAARLDIPYEGLCAEPFARRVARGTADRFWSTLAARQRLRAWVGTPIAD